MSIRKSQRYKNLNSFIYVTFIAVLVIATSFNFAGSAYGEVSKGSLWDVEITKIKVSKLNKKTNARNISYKLDTLEKNTVTPAHPVWIFVKYSLDNGKVWMNTDDTVVENDLLPENYKNSLVNMNLSGDVGLVESSGKKSIVWSCGEDGTNVEEKDLLVKIRAIQMCKIPADSSFQFGGNGSQALKSGSADIKGFLLGKYPATYDLFADFLNENGNSNFTSATDSSHQFWCKEMLNELDGGLEIKGEAGKDAVWSVKSGRERWPVGLITYWVAHDFALWAGLQIPTEPETEKAARNVGGIKGTKYSWGNEPKPGNEIVNFGKAIDHPTDVRAYEESWIKNKLANVFGLREMTGNIWEWQDTYWYDGGSEYDASQNYTAYNCEVIIKERNAELEKLKADGKVTEDEWMAERKKVALKGWRVIKGGSYFDSAYALNASSRIVGDTKVRHSAVGCRFVKR